MQLSWTESCNYSNVLKAKNKIENEKYADYIEESDEEAETKRQLNHSDGSSNSNQSSPDSNCSPHNKIANQNELNNDKECTLNLSRSSNDSINSSVEVKLPKDSKK